MQRLGLAVLAVAFVATSVGPARSVEPAAPAAPLSDGLDYANMDPACPACRDFWRFAEGRYAARHPIPADRDSVSNLGVPWERNLVRKRRLFDALARQAPSDPRSDLDKLGVFYRHCTDTTEREAAGAAPLEPELAKIDAMTGTPSVVGELGSLARIGVPVVFTFGSSTDLLDSQRTIAEISDGPLGLPEREYYLRTDARSKTERVAYAAFVEKIRSLAEGDGRAMPGPAATTPVVPAGALLALETSLAAIEPTQAERRSPLANYHVLTVTHLDRLAPQIDWTAYFASLGAPRFTALDVDRPGYVVRAARIVASTPLPVWKAYLRFRLLQRYADDLSRPYADASFAFYDAELYGDTKPWARWQKCVFEAGDQLQGPVGTTYIDHYFDARAKVRALVQLRAIQGALHDDLRTLAWMEPKTRVRAERKLARMVDGVGYPAHPRTYAALHLDAGPYGEQLLATRAFNFADDLRLIGKPTVRTRWDVPASEAYPYEAPELNEIVFEAGFLEPPIFDPAADDAMNYGAMGVVMGHETTHGFDDQGRLYDENGDFDDWWQKSDAAEFDRRAACIVTQFSSYAVGNVHENGEIEQGEAIADLGGATLAFRAFEKTPEARAGKSIGGFTPEQRFFLAFAQAYADSRRPVSAVLHALTDVHPVNMWRVIGTLSNMPEFQKAFHCKSFDAMVRKARCRIW